MAFARKKKEITFTLPKSYTAPLTLEGKPCVERTRWEERGTRRRGHGVGRRFLGTRDRALIRQESDG